VNKIQKIIVSSAWVLFANSSWATEVEESTLLNNLAYGQLIELNQYSPGQQKGLILRLFATRANPNLPKKLFQVKLKISQQGIDEN